MATRDEPSAGKGASGYLHGYTATEQDRLYRQARKLEYAIHDRLPFQRCRHLLEVGCGVGAQSEILLRHFPELEITGVDVADENLQKARENLERLSWAEGRWRVEKVKPDSLPHRAETFDGAFLCWVLEHVGDPMRTLSEVRRVLRVGSPVVCTEVQNATFFIEPYSPNTLQYWMAYNDRQWELGGDPFVGAKLGNLLQAVGFGDVRTEVKTFHLDNRRPGERAEFLEFWTELLLSGAPELEKAGAVSSEVVEGMKAELDRVGHDPNAVFWYSFVQARSVVR